MPTNIVWRAYSNPVVEQIFNQWNLRYELLEAVERSTIVSVDDQQSRSVALRAEPEKVEQYYQQMRAGAQFPPLVLREPRIKVDGNTREAAAARLGLQYVPAYIVHDIPTSEVARALSATINQTNGNRLAPADAYHRAIEMLHGDLEFTPDQVAQAVGYSASQIKKWDLQERAARRAESLGIGDAVRSIRPAGNREKLADVQHDEPFRRLANILSGVKIPAVDLAAVVKDIKDASSEAAELEVIDLAAAQWRPTGPGRKIVVNKKAKQMRMVIPQLLNLVPAEIIDHNKKDDDRKLWERLKLQADAVLREYDQNT